MDAPKDDDPRLAEIARGLVDDDPGFAARLEQLGEDLAADRDGAKRLRAVTAWFIVVGFAVLLFLGVLIRITGSADAPPTPPTPPTSPTPGTSAPLGRESGRRVPTRTPRGRPRARGGDAGVRSPHRPRQRGHEPAVAPDVHGRWHRAGKELGRARTGDATATALCGGLGGCRGCRCDPGRRSRLCTGDGRARRGA
ncbi:DUF3040 domain-containing protein [Yinghuangia sp. YIM S09857]|uniref:DUF3040 domain-containing protein n=1 Tax=Yinghuangia sp. YIM S09857 TaxID=3436929 RepID=UPI003F5377B1